MSAAIEDQNEERKAAMNNAKAAMGQGWVEATKKKRLAAAVERVNSGKNGQDVRAWPALISASA